jgi:3D (Asp-Asp-Asp) domain-containing protein
MMARPIISRSLGRKLVVTVIAIIGFVLMYEVNMFDLRSVGSALIDPTSPAAGARLVFTATAYCKGTTTASGVGVRTGIAASDPSILPVGSVVNITTDTTKYNGVYTIMDTGPRVQGRALDLYMWSCYEALAFGRRQVQLAILRLGWNPSASTASFIDRWFRRREPASAAVPSVPPSAPPDIPSEVAEGTTADLSEVPATDTTLREPSGLDPSATPAANPGSIVPVTPTLPAAALPGVPQSPQP